MIVLAVLAVWVAVGIVIALAAARRGHEVGPLVVLGMVFGPLLAGYVLSPLMGDERRPCSVVLDPGGQKEGDVNVLVVVLDEPACTAEAAPFVRALGPHLGLLVLARPVRSLAVSEGPAAADWDAAALALSQAALFLPDVMPRLVLLAGRPSRAVCAYLADHRFNYVVAVGEPANQVAMCRDPSLARQTVVVTTPPVDPGHPGR